MNWDLIFTAANNYALLMWLILALAPRREPVLTGLFYGGIGLLACAYGVIIIPLMTGLIGGSSGQAPDFTTLGGVQQLLASPGGATVGWIHYLAFDLFVGLWVARNADKYGFARWLQIPILLFVFMLGPLGLVLYLLLRFTRHNKVADAVVPQ
ncbi:ABA4-like family protein [Parasphingorhabdus sp.]|uniref:ABA4-like family protein n=1 Tax=Parasphingorhabdus sp. TaxID=2709688 RepID=UPI003A91183E